MHFPLDPVDQEGCRPVEIFFPVPLIRVVGQQKLFGLHGLVSRSRLERGLRRERLRQLGFGEGRKKGGVEEKKNERERERAEGRDDRTDSSLSMSTDVQMAVSSSWDRCPPPGYLGEGEKKKAAAKKI